MKVFALFFNFLLIVTIAILSLYGKSHLFNFLFIVTIVMLSLADLLVGQFSRALNRTLSLLIACVASLLSCSILLRLNFAYYLAYLVATLTLVLTYRYLKGNRCSNIQRRFISIIKGSH